MNASAYEAYCSGHGKVTDILRSVQHKPEYLAFEQRHSIRNPTSQPEVNRNEQQKSVSSIGYIYKRQTLKNRYSPRSEPGHGPVDDTPIDEFGSASLNVSKPVGRAKSSASLSSRPSFKSFRRSLRKSPANSTQTSRAPSPTPAPSPRAESLVEPQLDTNNDQPTFSKPPSRLQDDYIPPVPPIPASVLISIPMDHPSLSLSSQSQSLPPPTSKPLAFRDLLIKPIQRVCRYPLLLAQLRLPSSVGRCTELEVAIKATHLVAMKVDKAQELREIARKSELIVERLESHPVSCIFLN